MDSRTFMIYIVIGILVSSLGIWIIYDIIKNKELFSNANLKLERNLSNERYEILPEKKFRKEPYVPDPKRNLQNASIPVGSKNTFKFMPTPTIEDRNISIKRKQLQNASIPVGSSDKFKFMPTPTIEDRNMRRGHMKRNQLQNANIAVRSEENFTTTLKPSYDYDIETANTHTRETFENSDQFPSHNSIFCTCGGLIHKNCEKAANRVDSYNSGVTEFSTFPNKNWGNTMPYDRFVDKPDYENHSTNWYDIMPYDIYNSST